MRALRIPSSTTNSALRIKAWSLIRFRTDDPELDPCKYGLPELGLLPGREPGSRALVLVRNPILDLHKKAQSSADTTPPRTGLLRCAQGCSNFAQDCTATAQDCLLTAQVKTAGGRV